MDTGPHSSSRRGRAPIDLLDRALHYTQLPTEIAPFEREYVERTNRLALRLLTATVPFVVGVAWWNQASIAMVAALALAVVCAAAAAARLLGNPRHVAMISAVAATTMGAVLVHAGRGPFEVELHFYFFVVLATLAVYGNPRVVLVGAGAVVLDHVRGWWSAVAAGRSVEDATLELAVHSFFVGLVTIGMCFIARVFYDNVLRLERKVEARTGQLDQRQRDVRRLLDNARQAFLVIDGDGTITGERSSAIDRWFGAVPHGASWFELLRGVSPDLAERTFAAWQAVVDDFLPLELTLSQLPSHIPIGSSTLRVEYRIVSAPSTPLRALLIVEDVTRQIAEESLRADREEDLQLLAGLLDDRAWMMGFLEEIEVFVHDVEEERLGAIEATRALHTVKGNARMTGFGGLATLCHEVEERLAAEARPASPAALAPVAARAGRLVRRARTMMDAARTPSGGRSLRSRLERLRELARQAAVGAGKEIEVVLDDGGLRVELDGWSPILSNLTHAIQNAIDHGIEPADERLAAGKPRKGLLVLRTTESRGSVVLEIEDDGRGPPWADIARRARALGLPTETAAHLVDAVFHDGFTTAERVSETSGRGVGLAALRAATRTLGGTITLRGQAGRGATLRIEVPRARGEARRRSSGSLLRIDVPQRASR